MLKFLTILLISCLILAVESENRKLKYVQLLYRHGDRAPYETLPINYPTDVFPEGLGALTSLGFEQHYVLGQFLNERYANYLSANYSQSEVYIRATDVDRTLESAAANSASFFPAAQSSNWNATGSDIGKLWRPVAIHTVPIRTDYALNRGYCPRYDQLSNNLNKLPVIAKMLEENDNVITDLFKLVGLNKKPNAYDLWDVSDYLLCMFAHNQTETIPGINQTYFINNIYPLQGTVMYEQSNGTPEMARLRGGFMLNQFLSVFSNVSTNASVPGKKMVVYSAHDTTVFGLLAAMKLIDQVVQPPRYASLVLMEMYDDDTVAVFYKNMTSWNETEQFEQLRNKQPVLLTVPGCTEYCPLEQLKTVLSDMVENDPQAACFNSTSPANDDNNRFHVALGFALAGWGILAISLVVLVSKVVMKRRGNPGFERM